MIEEVIGPICDSVAPYDMGGKGCRVGWALTRLTFLPLGISQITGVPFECMQEPSIAGLWLVLRDLFLDLLRLRAYMI